MLHKLYKFLLDRQVLLALVIIAAGWLLFQVKGVIAAFFVSYIIMAALYPLVLSLRKRGVPRLLAVLVPYLATVLIIFLIILPLAPFMGQQVQSLFSNLPVYLDQAGTSLGFAVKADDIEKTLSSEFANLGRNAYDISSRVFGGVFLVVMTLIVSFYLLLYHDSFRKFLLDLFHPSVRDNVTQTLDQVDEKLGSWLRGQSLLSLFIFVLTYIALTVLQVPFAFPLAVIAGLLEVVPTFGPIISAVPAVVVAFTINPLLALIVAGSYVVIQLIENNFLVPKVMQRAVGLNPIIVILAVLTGAKLMGIAGALLSVPFLALMMVLFQSLRKNFN